MTGETPQTQSVEEAGMAPQNGAPAESVPLKRKSTARFNKAF
ncbi:hypothetical protein JMA_14780 [Jeotgalibacillus malaysiensis]|uniref:Uncharacterized protein n=1 Tax=Jeotgalibacillus malaysiensis TaxID=1508404 RepID=A0A0B5AKG1_9BACL|nr:hypothetical protein JMA_14780 [Jeotgalibacillus malaysiensis]